MLKRAYLIGERERPSSSGYFRFTCAITCCRRPSGLRPTSLTAFCLSVRSAWSSCSWSASLPSSLLPSTRRSWPLGEHHHVALFPFSNNSLTLSYQCRRVCCSDRQCLLQGRDHQGRAHPAVHPWFQHLFLLHPLLLGAPHQQGRRLRHSDSHTLQVLDGGRSPGPPLPSRKAVNGRRHWHVPVKAHVGWRMGASSFF